MFSFIQRKRETPPIYYIKSLPFGFNGLTIPPFGVFILEELKEAKELRLHELVHWEQYRREGLLQFIINYNRANSQYGYDGNPYEVEARYLESDFCQSNYTYCVRNGLAITVHDPDFRNGRP